MLLETGLLNAVNVTRLKTPSETSVACLGGVVTLFRDAASAQPYAYARHATIRDADAASERAAPLIVKTIVAPALLTYARDKKLEPAVGLR
jgi:hypothetical protein